MSTTTSFFIPVQEEIHQVEKLMQFQAEGHHADLQAALRHILASGGKRIRPTVTLLVGRMFGAPQDKLITLAAAIELLHTATLVHDDLIDGALLRRGIPTLNSQWSPGATVLTGDFLFARAAKLAADTNSIPVMSLFSKTLSIIVNGEISQLFSSRCQADREGYYQRIYAKTASLFETSAACAALISPVSDEILQAVRSFGYNIGMAFQIADDLLDYIGNPARMGKPVGNDLREGKFTLPLIIALRESTPADRERLLQMIEAPVKDGEIQQVVEIIRRYDGFAQTQAIAAHHVRQAMEALGSLPPSTIRESLTALCDYIVEREV